MSVFACKIISIFAHVERSDQNGPGAVETLHQRGIGCGGPAVAVDFRPRPGRQTFDIEQVLDRIRHTRQPPQGLAASTPGVDGLRLGQGALVGDVGKGVERCIAFVDAGQRGCRHLAGAHGTGPDGGGNICRALIEQGVAHGVNTGAGSS